jgi:hypothetical protein
MKHQNGENIQPLLIVAHTRVQVDIFKNRNELKSTDIKYVAEPRNLDGIRDCVVIFLHGWASHRMGNKIRDRVTFCEVHGVEIIDMSDTEALFEKLLSVIFIENRTSKPILDLLGLAYKRRSYLTADFRFDVQKRSNFDFSKTISVCTCGHRKTYHHDYGLHPGCLYCGCTGFSPAI